MYNFRHDYKKRPFGFGNIDEGRFIRARRNEESRKRQRTSNFNSNRKLPESFFKTQEKKVKSSSVKEDRMSRLVKWKAEREKVKKFEQAKKKPPFIVGLVHHKIYSPLNKDTKNIVCNHQSKRITRATKKNLINTFAKKVNSEDLNKNSKNITKEAKTSRASRNRNDLSFINKIATEFPKVPLFGRVPLYSMSPATVMPLIKQRSMARNRKSNEEFNVNIMKDSPRKCRLSKLSFDGKRAFNLRNSTTNNKNDNKVAKPIQNQTIKSTQNRTNTKTRSSPNYNISIVQSNSQSKQASFSPYIVSRRGINNASKEELKRGLNPDCSLNDDTPTKDTVMKNLNREANRLNKLHEKWMKPITKKKTTDRKKVVATKSSELICDLNRVLRNKYGKNESRKIVKYKTKSISIDSNKKKVAPMEHGKRLSLLRNVRLSKTINKTKSPLTIMKISKMRKIPKVQLNDSISYINSNQTPKGSTLKQQKKLHNIVYGMKSTNEVNVNDPIALNKVSVNEERNTKLDLAVVLSRIDDYDNILKEKVEKNVDTSNKEDMEEHNSATKVLRNRIVTSTDTPITKKRSFRKLDINLKELEHKENKTPLEKRKTRTILKRDIKNNEKTDIDNFDNNISSNKTSGMRRSTRKKEHSDCETYKETLLMTPYARKKIYSNNKE
ncbi:PREDICTED: uncharacterized protein LOC108549033 [Eufriesea mexicana]|uniref:uncharacterized protein LOC108549033 n=1 Tax=Eufriesea mexicana TaxID=516756 RepID=UPI00083C71FC|nr:PREDICTED: uncharacterized protein LOC108549033 [Eufriesea mexicana]